MTKIELFDRNNESQLSNSLQEAIETADKWYLYITENEVPLTGKRFPRLDTEGITDVKDLNEAISKWEQKLARELGVQSADQAGFHLVARQVGTGTLKRTSVETDEPHGLGT
jgi:hypothetical protein